MAKFIGRMAAIFLLLNLLCFLAMFSLFRSRGRPPEVKTRLLKKANIDLGQLEKLSVQGPFLPSGKRGLQVQYFGTNGTDFENGAVLKRSNGPATVKPSLAVRAQATGNVNLSDGGAHVLLQDKLDVLRRQGRPDVLRLDSVDNSSSGRSVDSQPQCDSECKHLNKVMANWPSDKPKAAIYFLTHSGRLKSLKGILSQLDQYFNTEYHYPIIIFHEQNFNKHIPTVRGYTSSEVFFQEIRFEIPSHLSKPVLKNIPCVSHITYRHMCRFHAKGVYEQAIMQDLEQAWRLDDDSEILRPLNYDVFRFMKSHNYIYGYVIKHWDSLTCTAGLWNSTKAYIEENNLKPTFFAKWPKPRLYYNNFEISSMKLWLSEGYQKFVHYLDQLGGMYYHRWGDAPIKGIAVSLFVPESQVHHFIDVSYRHRSMQNAVDDIHNKKERFP